MIETVNILANTTGHHGLNFSVRKIRKKSCDYLSSTKQPLHEGNVPPISLAPNVAGGHSRTVLGFPNIQNIWLRSQS